MKSEGKCKKSLEKKNCFIRQILASKRIDEPKKGMSRHQKTLTDQWWHNIKKMGISYWN
jgi:hypothetical protein